MNVSPWSWLNFHELDVPAGSNGWVLFRAEMFFQLKHRTFTQNAVGLDMFLVHWNYFGFCQNIWFFLPKNFVYIEQASWLKVRAGLLSIYREEFSKVSWWELKQVCFTIFQTNLEIVTGCSYHQLWQKSYPEMEKLSK